MIQDSVYLITGGASGLGEATAEILLSEGAKVTVIDLRWPADDSVLRKYDENTLFLQVDVTSEKDVLNAFDATKRKFGKLNGVVNCAGITIAAPIYDFAKHEPHCLEEFTKVINVNLIGTFNVVRLAIPLIIENTPNSDGERGVIVNTSSIMGHEGHPACLAYSASKAGVIGLTYPLAKSCASYGIRVVDIAPGYMDTPMTKQHSKQTISKDAMQYKFGFPLRKGKPKEFGELVKTIIENPMLNGTSIRLDGAFRT